MSSVCDICPFCREPAPAPADDEEHEKRIMKRIDANDPAAMLRMGSMRYEEGDYEGAFEYWAKAAELGFAEAHHNLGVAYDRGEGVEKDKEKAVYHYERAAIGGDPRARYNLGFHEERNGRVERAVKHFVIAAKHGLEDSMKALWGYYTDGNINKEDLEATLRAHQAAVDAMKSPQREAVAVAEWKRVG
jgi:TPR repeat protein